MKKFRVRFHMEIQVPDFNEVIEADNEDEAIIATKNMLGIDDLPFDVEISDMWAEEI